VATVWVAACTGFTGRGGGASPTPFATATTVSWFIFNTNARQTELFEPTVRQPFEREQTNVHLDVTAGGGNTKFVTLVTSGQSPDAVWWGLPEFWTGGFLRQLNDLIARDKVDMKGFPQATHRARNVIRDAVIALPIQIGGNWPVMPYNPDLFARAGVPEPPATWGDPAWTWEAFADVCRRLQRWLSAAGGDAPRWAVNWSTVTDWYLEAHPYLWRASWLSADWQQATPDAPAMIEAIQAAADLFLKHGASPRPGESKGDDVTSFVNGTFAMLRTAGGGLGQVADAVQKGAPFRYAPLPTGKVPAAAIQCDGMSLPKQGKQPDAAWLLSTWLAGNTRWGVARGLPPGRPDLFDAWASEVYGSLAQTIRLEVYRRGFAVGAGQDAVMLQPRLPEIRALLQPALTAVFAGERSVEDALRGLKGPIQALLQPIG
jgi:multiple sugar transport system substrate-binding protein